MKSFAFGAVLLALTASTAGAQVGYQSFAGDPGLNSPPLPMPQSLLLDFNGADPVADALVDGVSFSGSFSFQTGLLPGLAAPPAGVTSKYFATPASGGQSSSGSAIIDFQGFLQTQIINSLSFYWGSIDRYNKLEVLDSDLNTIQFDGGLNFITGLNVAVPDANGNQFVNGTNRRLYLDLAGVDNFRALKLTSTSRAFEIDDVAVNSIGRATVPEPATASVLALGLALLGAAGARRKRNQA